MISLHVLLFEYFTILFQGFFLTLLFFSLFFSFRVDENKHIYYCLLNETHLLMESKSMAAKVDAKKIVKIGVAAELLGVSVRTVSTYLAQNVFTVEYGVGDRRYLHLDEIEFITNAKGRAKEKIERLRDFRIRKGRLKAN